uniref:HMG box domain-containing protein n=1 Tax=Macrostomum lignano TaxID=282301 RepID=A0A1I8ILN6_9PLAT
LHHHTALLAAAVAAGDAAAVEAVAGGAAATSSVIQTETRATSAEAAASTARAFFAVAAAGAAASAEAADAGVSRAGEAASPAFSGASSAFSVTGAEPRIFRPVQPAGAAASVVAVSWGPAGVVEARAAIGAAEAAVIEADDGKATADAADEHEAAAAAACSAVAVDGRSAGLTDHNRQPDAGSQVEAARHRGSAAASCACEAVGAACSAPGLDSVAAGQLDCQLLDGAVAARARVWESPPRLDDAVDVDRFPHLGAGLGSQRPPRVTARRSGSPRGVLDEEQLADASWMEAELGSLMMRLLTVGSSRTGPEELMKRLQLASGCMREAGTGGAGVHVPHVIKAALGLLDGLGCGGGSPSVALAILSWPYWARTGFAWKCTWYAVRPQAPETAFLVFLKASKIIEAVNSAFGYKPEIDCFAPGKKHGEKSKPAYLAELRICFSKDLTPRECESSGREVPQPRHSAHTLYYDPELPRSFHREAEANVYSPIKMSRSVKNLIASWIETERPTAVSERKRIWTSPCKDDEDVQLPEKLNY